MDRMTEERLAEIADVIERETNPDTATELGWSLLERELLFGLKYEKVRVKELERKHRELADEVRELLPVMERMGVCTDSLSELLEQGVSDE